MKNHLQTYDFELTTLAPVHIGSSQVIGKKDYLFLRKKNQLVFLDIHKMISDLIREEKDALYEEFISNPNDPRSLGKFLGEIGYKSNKDWGKWEKYRVEIGDPDLMDFRNPGKKGGGRRIEINAFMRDAYGLPYVPGSSLKGALRTCLTTDFFTKHPDEADDVADLIVDEPTYLNDRKYQQTANREMNKLAFHRQITDKREKGTALNEMVNDTMRGLIVSDSRPLCNEDMCVCQKIDWTMTDENALPTMRECIKPGVKINFTITVDPYLFQHDDKNIKKDILDAINTFFQYYQDVFFNRFSDVPPVGQTQDVLYLGGGVGYVSKTATYSVFHDYEEGLQEVRRILNSRFDKHNHLKDKISPSALKCTEYNNIDYQFGPCAVTRFERID